MALKQDNNVPDPHARRRRLTRWMVILLVMFVVGGTFSRAIQHVGRNTEAVGFMHGLWQGAVMPCALPLLVMGQDVHIYSPLNSGRGYKIGYTMGVNLCGLIFFSFFFARVSRLRRKLSQTNES